MLQYKDHVSKLCFAVTARKLSSMKSVFWDSLKKKNPDKKQNKTLETTYFCLP